MASPTCTVADGAGAAQPTTNGVTVTAGDVITIALVSVAGVSSWSISCIGTDELQVAATINAGLTVNGVSKTATFTMPSAAALGFRSTVTDANGISTSTQFGIYSLVSGLRLGWVGETTEGSAAYGTCATINAKIRQAAGGGGTLPNTVPAKVTKTANYTIVASTDYLVIASTAGIAITLPAAPADGATFVIANTSTGTVTIGGNLHNLSSTGSASMTLATTQAATCTWDAASTTWIVT